MEILIQKGLKWCFIKVFSLKVLNLMPVDSFPSPLLFISFHIYFNINELIGLNCSKLQPWLLEKRLSRWKEFLSSLILDPTEGNILKCFMLRPFSLPWEKDSQCSGCSRTDWLIVSIWLVVWKVFIVNLCHRNKSVCDLVK